MDLLLIGPGRAGMALGLRALSSGHRIRGVVGRTDDATEAAADRLAAHGLSWDDAFPTVDLVVLAVRDDDLPSVATLTADRVDDAGGAIHVAGLVGVGVLDPLAARGVPTASFHPLQTLPDPDAGAAALEGAWVGIASDDDLFADRLFAFAADLGMRPFELPEEAKATYHAAAAAAANFPLTALVMARRLFEASGVPFGAARPLVEAIVANAFDLGPETALTGPVARGDVGTVQAQLDAVAAAAPDMAEHFAALVRATAHVAGTSAAFEGIAP